ncbi:MAG TPA: XRE family transcriptional regulator [Anaerolineales bacterium]|nr:XRE family transcriptional regulator [Anaerolineales bacterium]
MTIGQRIKQARKASRLSLRALADQAGISAMAISKYERNESVPSSGVLARLAQALEVPLDYFFRPASQGVPLRAYRKHASLKKKDESAILARIQEWLDRYHEIENLFPQAVRQADLPVYPIEGLVEIEQAALDLRKRWRLGLDAIENLTGLLEDQGFKVGLVEGFDDFDACTFLSDNAPVIVTKADTPGDRQRYNLSHELGHIVLEISSELDQEKAAHRFAGAFLVPATVARYELGDQRSDLELHELYLLKRKYGLSMQAWIYRAKDLGIISEWTARRLFKRFRSHGWRLQEPGEPLPPEEPLRLELLVYRALAEDLISRSRAQELLGKPLQDIRYLEKVQANDVAVGAGD